MHPLIDAEFVRSHHRQLLDEAAAARLAAAVPRGRTPWRARAGLGLVRIGYLLAGDSLRAGDRLLAGDDAVETQRSGPRAA